MKKIVKKIAINNKKKCANVVISVAIVSLCSGLSTASFSGELEDKINKIEQELVQLKDIKSKALSSASTQKNISKKWQINSYGSMLYKNQAVYKNTQDTTPENRGNVDLERVVLEFVYDIDDTWQVELELEYEHGGTGTTLEYDAFEEFGEFENEIEAGGEVVIEKLQIKYSPDLQLAQGNVSFKLGHIFVPVGLGTELHKPDQYFTTQRHWSEASMIPQVWHETGVNVLINWQSITVQTLITTGLNSEYFRTYRWVATGQQKRFEQVNADDLALTFRLDYGNVKAGNGIGVSFYTGNTTGNRNNPNKVEGNGNLTLLGVHGAFSYGHWLAKGQYLYGQLEDSAAITQANKTTPGLRPGNFAQLGSEAESAFVELAFNSQQFFGLSKPLYLFTAFEYANPIKAVSQGEATKRFDQQELSIGINYMPNNQLVFKAQYALQSHAQANLANTNSFSLSVGYNFSI